MSVENLFGHLCSGTEFSHDKEMEVLLASQRVTLKRQRCSEDVDSTTSNRRASIEANLYQRSSSDPANRYRVDPDDRTHHDALDYTRGRGKRQRLSPPFDEEDQEVKSSQTRLSSEELLSSTPRRVTRYSFGAYRRASSKSSVPTHIAALPNPGIMSVKFGAGHEDSVASDALELSPGTQAKPIELSDSLSTCTDGDENGKAEAFLLDELPDQEAFPDCNNLIQSGQETQLSLSTSAFESQGSHGPSAGTNSINIQHRKEAYTAAKELSGAWEVEHSLISLRASHDEEELEL